MDDWHDQGATSLDAAPAHLRDALCLVLDVDDLVAARRTAAAAPRTSTTTPCGSAAFSMQSLRLVALQAPVRATQGLVPQAKARWLRRQSAREREGAGEDGLLSSLGVGPQPAAVPPPLSLLLLRMEDNRICRHENDCNGEK